eukprot:CAMPEP_0113483652 /NCGR_PEP_ID=MMETSP0014_2-20120614/23544_1 /TAXON_ID=2857 /ORGANISM="Nitzschia sp." /LENGTH=202 /DNA_ID=CAMNT_0000377205 /DNA_START=108 /DNA_END=716 /DNA_ORIENTATION=- /assembly_acc=CAM_ASM_000159
MSTEPKRPKQPMRPSPSPYYHWSEDIRKAGNPDAEGLTHQQVTGMMRKKWNGLPEDEKKVYQDRAVEDQERYKREMEQYETDLAQWKVDIKAYRSSMKKKETTIVDPGDPQEKARREKNREQQRRFRAKRSSEETEEQREERLLKERERLKKYRKKPKTEGDGHDGDVAPPVDINAPVVPSDIDINATAAAIAEEVSSKIDV